MCQTHDENIGDDDHDHEVVERFVHRNLEADEPKCIIRRQIFLLWAGRGHHLLDRDPLLLGFGEKDTPPTLVSDPIELINSNTDDHVQDEEDTQDDKGDEIQRHVDVVVK